WVVGGAVGANPGGDRGSRGDNIRLAGRRRRQGSRVGRAWIYCARGGGVRYYRRADQLQVPSAARGRGAATGRTLSNPLAALSCREKSRGAGSADMPR